MDEWISRVASSPHITPDHFFCVPPCRGMPRRSAVSQRRGQSSRICMRSCCPRHVLPAKMLKASIGLHCTDSGLGEGWGAVNLRVYVLGPGRTWKRVQGEDLGFRV